MEVVEEWELSTQSLHLAVNLLDRYLASVPIPKTHFQLVGVACIWTASKYVERIAPTSSHCSSITANTFSRPQVQTVELHILASLGFNLFNPTPASFMRRYIEAGQVDLANYKKELESLVRYLLDVSMLHGDCMHFVPSMVTASAIFLGRLKLRVAIWTPTLRHFTGFSLPELKVCCEVLLNGWRRVRQHGFRGILQRYAKPRRHSVSEISPLESLPENVFYAQR
ncbi:hypothetical protein BSKO_00936 [Bryopsis sp. KO-2023]|nr:hypothetical protein BSKO_00936 [Bryopsis sp. KO-2023]